MEITDSESCPSYAKGPPWLFKGSALYQLHLVKADTARPFIPKEFKLVEAFGYTLGGFFLARYDDSPAGRFDELVVIAGIVWNPPTSCAWAARVLVNSREACIHGRKDIGLPSHVAKFSKAETSRGFIPKEVKLVEDFGYLLVERLVPISRMQRNKGLGFLNRIGLDAAFSGREDNGIEIQVNEMEDSTATAVCNINLPSAQPGSKSDKKHFWPVIRMSLPSFSGQTDYNPHLLKYSCQIECRVRAVEPAKISKLNTASINDRDGSSEDSSFTSEHSTKGVFSERDAFDRSVSVLLSKPILALEFNSLRMQVEAPTVVTLQSKKSRTS